MPELPEVETVCRGIKSRLPFLGEITMAVARRKNLRIDIPIQISEFVKGQPILDVRRRAKYILFDTPKVTVISHLGMSGSWRFSEDPTFKLHDHFYFHFSNGTKLIFNDPRRFGLIDIQNYQEEDKSKWIKDLGIEPLSRKFTADSMLAKSIGKMALVKSFVMDQKNVVGIGNIYASEALFLAGIKPARKVSSLTRTEWESFIKAIRKTLLKSIRHGGTTLKDYFNANGESGTYQKKLFVYDRSDESCWNCANLIRQKVIGGRSTYWCSKCQK